MTCLHVERWADALAGHPFDTLLGLERSAVAAATPLTEAEVDEALSAPAEPLASTGDPELDGRLAAARETYEERFGRAFIINATGRSGDEIVTELQRRLENGPAAELAEVSNQLRGIALLRLRALYASNF